RHGAAVAEAEVDVAVAVEVGDLGAVRFGEVDGEATRRLVHPGHRHTAEQAAAGGLERGMAARVGAEEGGALARQEAGEGVPVDHAHRWSAPASTTSRTR